jgi:hypothetical protein
MRRRTLVKCAVLGTAIMATPAAAQAAGASSMARTSGRVAVNGVELYDEIHGEGVPGPIIPTIMACVRGKAEVFRRV